MKIDLTKEEWEFAKKIMSMQCGKYEKSFPYGLHEYDLVMSEQFLYKLGSEWIDEEEEMRKFREGFSYRKKVKDE